MNLGQLDLEQLNYNFYGDFGDLGRRKLLKKVVKAPAKLVKKAVRLGVKVATLPLATSISAVSPKTAGKIFERTGLAGKGKGMKLAKRTGAVAKVAGVVAGSVLLAPVVAPTVVKGATAVGKGAGTLATKLGGGSKVVGKGVEKKAVRVGEKTVVKKVNQVIIQEPTGRIAKVEVPQDEVKAINEENKDITPDEIQASRNLIAPVPTVVEKVKPVAEEIKAYAPIIGGAFTLTSAIIKTLGKEG